MFCVAKIKKSAYQTIVDTNFDFKLILNFIFVSSGSLPALSVSAYNALHFLVLYRVKSCLSGFHITARPLMLVL